MKRLPSLAATACLLGAALCPLPLSAAPAPATPGLWKVYDDVFAHAKYVDSTHTIAPNIPVWKGFG